VDDEFMPGFYKDMQKLELAAQRQRRDRNNNSWSKSPSKADKAQSLWGEDCLDTGRDLERSELVERDDVACENASFGGRCVHWLIRNVLVLRAKVFGLAQLVWRATYGLGECDCVEGETAEGCCQLEIELPSVAQQLLHCLWRAAVVRWRNRPRILATFVISGLAMPLIFLCTNLPLLQSRFRTEKDINTADSVEEELVYGRLLFFSFFPFVATLLCSLWADDRCDLFDRRVFNFERNRRLCSSAVIFPVTSFLAEVLVVRLPPSLLACAVTYPIVAYSPTVLGLLRCLYIFTLILLAR
jgi:hypothetical protein